MTKTILVTALLVPLALPPNATAQESSGGSQTVTNSMGMRFNRIPAGTFLMGSPENEDERADDEVQHQVTITRNFYIGVTEVTQAQWQKVMGTTPWEDRSSYRVGAENAASYLTWNDAVAFCSKLSQIEGREYRLPTEAEWEYACRAGSGTAYEFGNDPSRLDRYAWYDENAENVDEYYAHPVATKRPNGFGLYDMHGNVYEYCSDWYDDYPEDAVSDPAGPAEGSRRVMRGGAVGSNRYKCRSAFRNNRKLESAFYGSGFRVVLEAEPAPGFPRGSFLMTTKHGEESHLVLESAPLTLREVGEYTGMVWIAKPVENAPDYFRLTTQYLADNNQVLEGSDGKTAAIMVKNNGVIGTAWKAIPAGDGYYYLTSAFMESRNKVLSGNVGDVDGASAAFGGVPYMVDLTSAGDRELWRFVPLEIPAGDHPYFHTEETKHAAHWSYKGSTGPEHWGDLDESYGLAKTGRRQSPIDIRSAISSNDLPPLDFNYVPSTIHLINNGHTIKQDGSADYKGSYVGVEDNRYLLRQFHFHAPSEHTVNGKHYPMEMHLVHKSEDGQTVAVVAVFIEEGESNPAFDLVWSMMPAAKNSRVDTTGRINKTALLPKDRRYYVYEGSFTTPPCTEQVLWFVLKKPITMSRRQLNRFRSIYHGNNRPIQNLNDRPIAESR